MPGLTRCFGNDKMTETVTLNTNAAALYVGLSASTLAKMRLTGNSPRFLKLGRRVAYRRVDLDEWLETRVARDTTDANIRLPKSLTGQQLR
jgi:predicted DNA-binding transcriptional regulator AlpA